LIRYGSDSSRSDSSRGGGMLRRRGLLRVGRIRRSPPGRAARLLAAALGTLLVAWIEPAKEPAPEVIQAGNCQAPVCTSIDFGDYSFRYYAPARTNLIRFIPKGACRCGLVGSDDTNFSGSIVLSLETPDGRTMHNISVLRVWPPGHPRARWPVETTFE